MSLRPTFIIVNLKMCPSYKRIMANRPKIPPAAAAVTTLDWREDAPPVKTAPGTPPPVPVAWVTLPALALALVEVAGTLVIAATDVFFVSIRGVATTAGVPLTADAADVWTVVRTRLNCGTLEAIEAIVTPLLIMMVTGAAQTVQTWHWVWSAAAADVRWVATTLSMALVLETSTTSDLVVPFSDPFSVALVVSAALVVVVFSPSFFLVVVSWRTTEVDFWFPFSFVLLSSLLLVVVLFFCEPCIQLARVKVC